MNSIEEYYLSEARRIKTETLNEANTALRVGGLFEASLAYLFNLLATIQPGSTQQQVVSVYNQTTQYAFDINNPRAVLYPNSSNEIRMWVLKPTATPEAKIRNVPSYNALSEWVDTGLTDVNSFTRVKNAVQYDELAQLIQDLGIIGGSGGGLDFTEIPYTEGTLTYVLPDPITTENLKQIDGLTGQSINWDLDHSLNPEGNAFTLSNAENVDGSGALRLWYYAPSDAENPGGSPFGSILDYIQESASVKFTGAGTTSNKLSLEVQFPENPGGGPSLTAIQIRDLLQSLAPADFFSANYIKDLPPGNGSTFAGVPAWSDTALYGFTQEPKPLVSYPDLNNQTAYWTLKNTANTQTPATRSAPNETASSQWKKIGVSSFDDLTDKPLQHYKGNYPTLAALQSAIPTGTLGDYATVDSGAGNVAQVFSWDAQDGWVTATTGSGGPTIVQTTGSGTTVVMSQDAVTKAIKRPFVVSFVNPQRTFPDYYPSAAQLKTILLRPGIASFSYSVNAGSTFITPVLPLADPINIAAGTDIIYRITFTPAAVEGSVYFELV